MTFAFFLTNFYTVNNTVLPQLLFYFFKKSQNSDKYLQNGFVRFLGDIFFCTFIDATQLS